MGFAEWKMCFVLYGENIFNDNFLLCFWDQDVCDSSPPFSKLVRLLVGGHP